VTMNCCAAGEGREQRVLLVMMICGGAGKGREQAGECEATRQEAHPKELHAPYGGAEEVCVTHLR
jgi:hypothetical protein